MFKQICVAASLVVGSVAAAGAATVVGFGSLGAAGLAPGASYDEAGYRFTTVSGPNFGSGESDSVGNPGKAFWIGYFLPRLSATP